MTKATIIYTDGGSVNLRGKWFGGWGFAGTSNDGTVFSGYGACNSDSSTNNYAELDGYLKACEFVIKKDIREVAFKLDSKYVLQGANKYLPLWERNNWLTRQGQPVKNKQMWLSIRDVRLKLDKLKIKHEYEWVKGHSGVVGNELADKGATKGIALAKAESYEPVYTYQDEETVKLVKKVKVVLPKMLCLRRMPVITSLPIPFREESEQFVYSQTNFDDKKNVRSKYYGRQGTDVIESVLLTKTRIAPIDLVHEALGEKVGKGNQVPAILQLDKILSKNNLAELTVKGKEALSVFENDIMLNGDVLLGYPIGVPLLCLDGFSSLNHKYTLLDCYLKDLYKKENVVDITEQLFTIDDKGVHKLKPEALKQTSFRVNIELGDKVANTALLPNVNVPPLNKISTIAKDSKGLKIKVYLHNVTDLTFQYSFIFEAGNGDIAIFDSPCSNVRVFKKIAKK